MEHSSGFHPYSKRAQFVCAHRNRGRATITKCGDAKAAGAPLYWPSPSARIGESRTLVIVHWADGTVKENVPSLKLIQQSGYTWRSSMRDDVKCAVGVSIVSLTDAVHL